MNQYIGKIVRLLRIVKTEDGMAQIPLMIGLLIMAIAVPVATKLVQNNQDTRNRAAINCSTSGTHRCSDCCDVDRVVDVAGDMCICTGSSPCDMTFECGSWKNEPCGGTRQSRDCSNDCGNTKTETRGTCATAPTATKVPTARPSSTSDCNVYNSSGNSAGCNANSNCVWINSKCWSKTSAPTLTPTRVPTSATCSGFGSTYSCLETARCTAGTSKGTSNCTNGLVCCVYDSARVPTNTATPTIIGLGRTCHNSLPCPGNLVCVSGQCAVRGTSCDWSGNFLNNGEEKCFNSALGTSDKVRCTSGVASVTQHYSYLNCNTTIIGQTCTPNGAVKCINTASYSNCVNGRWSNGLNCQAGMYCDSTIDKCKANPTNTPVPRQPCSNNGCTTEGQRATCTATYNGATFPGTKSCELKIAIPLCLGWSTCVRVTPTSAPMQPCSTNGCSTLGSETSCTATNSNGASFPGTKRCVEKISLSGNCLGWDLCTRSGVTNTPVPPSASCDSVGDNCCLGAPAYCINGLTCSNGKCTNSCGQYTGPDACNAQSARGCWWDNATLNCRDGNYRPPSYITATRAPTAIVRATATPTSPFGTCTQFKSPEECRDKSGCWWDPNSLMCKGNVITPGVLATATPLPRTKPCVHDSDCSMFPCGYCMTISAGVLRCNYGCNVTRTQSPTPTTGGDPERPTNRPTTRPSGGPIETMIPRPTDALCNGVTKPAEVCTPERLQVRPQCNGTSWDFDEQLCNQASRTDICGGAPYCCPAAGGSWTTDMTQCPTHNGLCTQCIGKPDAKSKGDANCDGSTDIYDAAAWSQDFFAGDLGTVAKTDWRADFNCDGKVDIYDAARWQQQFLLTL